MTNYFGVIAIYGQKEIHIWSNHGHNKEGGKYDWSYCNFPYISVFVMSLSRFRAQPRKGHLAIAKRIFDYLCFYQKAPSGFGQESGTTLPLKTKSMIGPGLSMGTPRNSYRRYSRTKGKLCYHHHICGSQPTP